MRNPSELVKELYRYAEDKMKKTMSEFKHGDLHSGSKSGPEVTSREQAIAIGLSQSRKAGEDVAPKKYAQPRELAKTLYAAKQRYDEDNPAKTAVDRAAGALGEAAGTAAGAALFA